MKPIHEQVILITGSTDGLGRGVATALAAQGATVLLHGRSDERGEQVLHDIREQTGNEKIFYYRADFARLANVRSLAEQIQKQHTHLDTLVNNAGLGVTLDRHVSEDGHEMIFQVDYLAPFLLTNLLAPLLVQSAPARVVSVTSAGQAPINFNDVMLEHHYDGVQAYCQAKLAEVMLTFDLAQKLTDQGVTVNCLHPASYMPTKMVVGLFSVHSKVEDGIRSVLHLVTAPELDGVSGRYFRMEQEDRALAQAYDERARLRLRQLGERLTGLSNTL